MSAESNTEAARRIVEEGFSQGRLEVFDEVCGPDYVSHDPAEEEDVQGIEAHKERCAGYRTAMSDFKVTVDGVFGSGDLVAMRWSVQGTNDGELAGMPATGRQVAFTGMSIDRFDAGGKLVETWDQWDNAGFMQQLGVSAEAVDEAG